MERRRLKLAESFSLRTAYPVGLARSGVEVDGGRAAGVQARSRVRRRPIGLGSAGRVYIVSGLAAVKGCAVEEQPSSYEQMEVPVVLRSVGQGRLTAQTLQSIVREIHEVA